MRYGDIQKGMSVRIKTRPARGEDDDGLYGKIGTVMRKYDINTNAPIDVKIGKIVYCMRTRDIEKV